MKGGLLYLTAIQVASLRIIFSAIVLIPWTIQFWKGIPRKKWLPIIVSGCFGSLLPAFLFCIAEEKIDSGLAGTLNSLTPVFVVVTGVLFFSSIITSKKVLGIIVAFGGSVLLLLSKGAVDFKSNWGYAFLILIATISYGLNANVVHKYLKGIESIKIASVALTVCSLPSLIILYLSGFFKLDLLNKNIDASLFYTAILGVFGTAIATILYYILVKKSGAVFSSMVTYCIPVVANIWGIVFGESIGIMQFICLLIILSGVYIANVNMNFKIRLGRKNIADSKPNLKA